ncbi:hypothetical protein O6H91_08G030500 [Diphasiastrum complanatum]|uniref:Uncharacterized protein n=1 Tax=Diphasiastrum complanatum TaxID=34168 RepID=A0ACC2CW48_DIPCM|nr:hypothetical protein O6H91_08G030500 [Diphasiastrum complanatum]
MPLMLHRPQRDRKEKTRSLQKSATSPYFTLITRLQELALLTVIDPLIAAASRFIQMRKGTDYRMTT